jgi:two-component system NarL family sensor kinase
MHCDLQGRVLWMSKRSKFQLGELDLSAQDVVLKSGEEPLILWRLLTAPDGVVVGAQPLGPVDAASHELLEVQSNLLGHFFHLLVAEHRLSTLAREIRPRGGRKAIRQMELERTRLGRELHTGAGQMLAAILLQLDAIATEMPAPPQPVREALDRIATLASDTLDQVRSLSRRLHPPEWQRLELNEAIRQLWRVSGIPEHYDATLELDPLPVEPELEVKVLFYRSLQEALSNLVRHANATKVSATLKGSDGHLTLTLQDNGVGFNIERSLRGPADVAAGIGLRSIREHAEALGGKLVIESGASGTTLVISVGISPVEL